MPIRVYKIRPGDSLSAIAEQHGFGSKWQPILNYNVEKKILTSRDERKIPIGVSIVIPRMAEEYDAAIKGLQDLLSEVEKDMVKSLKELDGYKAEADRVGGYVDIAADVVLAAKGAVKASIKYGPRYAKYIMRKEVLQAAVSTVDKLVGLSDSNDGLIIKNAGKAVVDQSVMIQAKRAFDAQKGQSSFTTGMAQSMGKKAAVVSAKSIAPVEMANGVSEIVDVLCDMAFKVGKGTIAVVEQIAPSKAAKAFVWFVSGEHPDDTNDRMKRFVASTNKNSSARLRTTIVKLQSEKKEVYGLV